MQKFGRKRLLPTQDFLVKRFGGDFKEPTEVIMIIRWERREQWKSILLEQLEQIEKRFAEQMGNISHELLDSSE